MKKYPPRIELGDFSGEKTRAKEVLKREFAVVDVLYHSLTLSPTSWRDVYLATTGQAKPDHPGSDDKRLEVRWIQYKLNELGYPCGPLTGELNAATRSALCHHGYTVDDLAESDDEAQKGLIDALTKGEGSLGDPVADRSALTDASKASRIFADPGHALLRATALRGADVPLAAAVRLVSKDDADGTGEGVLVPGAVGAARCAWAIVDRSEDGLKKYPKHVEHVFKPGSKRKIRHVDGAYVEKVEASMELAALAAPGDASTFRAGGLPDLVPSRGSGDSATTLFSVDGVSKRRRDVLGKTAVLLHASYSLARVGFAASARLSLEGVPGGSEIEARHKRLASLSSAFGDQPPKEDPLAAETGTLSLWRRDWVTHALGEAGRIRTEAEQAIASGTRVSEAARALTAEVHRWAARLFEILLRKQRVPDFVVLALGSFARREMAPRSDMDLVYLRRDKYGKSVDEWRVRLSAVFKKVDCDAGGFLLDDVTGSVYAPEKFAIIDEKPFETASIYESSRRAKKLWTRYTKAVSGGRARPKLLDTVGGDAKKRWTTIEGYSAPEAEINVKNVVNCFASPIGQLAYYCELFREGDAGALRALTYQRIAALRAHDIELGAKLADDYDFVLGLRYEAHLEREAESDVLAPTSDERARLVKIMKHLDAYVTTVRDYCARQREAL